MAETPPTLPPVLAAPTRRAAALRQRLAEPGIVAAPGAYDALTARLVERAGFPAVYVTGSGVSISTLGVPDLGMVSFTEMLERVRQIADVTSIPVIADADTGYGGPLNVMRTVREFERAGVAAVQIEDQAWPKKCGHEPGRQLVPVEEMEARIAAAADARHGATVLVARTDARAAEGFEAALERAQRYRAAGADVLFVEAPESEAELTQLPRRLDAPLLANMVEGGRTPLLPLPELGRLGFRLAIYPNALTRLFACMGGRLLDDLMRTGTTAGFADRMLDHRGLWDLFDNAEWRRLEDRYAGPQAGRRAAALPESGRRASDG